VAIKHTLKITQAIMRTESTANLTPTFSCEGAGNELEEMDARCAPSAAATGS
jgi:hypothetical protein